MPIGARPGHGRQGNLAARTRAVHHHHRTSDAFFECSGIAPRIKISAAAGGEANNDFNRPIRPAWLRQGRRGQQGTGRGQKTATLHFHDIFPSLLFLSRSGGEALFARPVLPATMQESSARRYPIGNQTRTWVPTPSVLSMASRPRWRITIWRVMASPSPVPPLWRERAPSTR